MIIDSKNILILLKSHSSFLKHLKMEIKISQVVLEISPQQKKNS